MEIHRRNDLLAALRESYLDRPLEVTFTQWEGEEEDEDEQVSQFRASLLDVALDKNEFGTYDLLLTFQPAGEEAVEILMELPREEENLAYQDEAGLRLFGTEAELILARRD